MQTIQREDAVVYEFGPDMDSALVVEPGETFKIETWDAREGKMFNRGSKSLKGSQAPDVPVVPPGNRANPVAGPVYIEGVSANDVVAVHIEEIIPDKWGFTGHKGSTGILHDRVGWEECHEDYFHIIEHEPGPSGTTADGIARFEIDGKCWTWNLNPHIGTIATAPARGIQDTVTSQGPWGGNVDVRHVAAGNTVYLNSFNDGGQLFIGDVHACQSDSELTVLADETPAEVTLSIEIIENTSVPGIFQIETPDELVQVDSARNAGGYQNALENCYLEMIRWLVEDYGYSQREAYLNMSINPGVCCHVYQFIADAGFFVCGVEFPRNSLDHPAFRNNRPTKSE